MLVSTFLLCSRNFMWRDPTQWNVKKPLVSIHSLNHRAQVSRAGCRRINQEDVRVGEGRCERGPRKAEIPKHWR
jgi:hypothetical protein